VARPIGDDQAPVELPFPLVGEIHGLVEPSEVPGIPVYALVVGVPGGELGQFGVVGPDVDGDGLSQVPPDPFVASEGTGKAAEAEAELHLPGGEHARSGAHGDDPLGIRVEKGRHPPDELAPGGEAHQQVGKVSISLPPPDVGDELGDIGVGVLLGVGEGPVFTKHPPILVEAVGEALQIELRHHHQGPEGIPHPHRAVPVATGRPGRAVEEEDEPRPLVAGRLVEVQLEGGPFEVHLHHPLPQRKRFLG